MSADRGGQSRLFRPRRRTWVAAVAGALLALAAMMSPPANAAILFGNYNLHIPDRFDFHTWIFFIGPCGFTSPYPTDCARVSARPQPIAKADAFLSREASFDADLWLIEVEDRKGRHFLDDSIVTGSN